MKLNTSKPFALPSAYTAVCVALAVCGSAEGKTLQFSGYEWEVKTGANLGPGPNNWDERNAWVDQRGLLHLKLSNRDGKWSCAQVSMKDRLGFGRYQFWTKGRIDQLDPNVVFGLFTYPPPDVGPDGTHEIDVEFARWGQSSAPNGNYTVWPAKPGVARSSHRFNFHLDDDATTHRFFWTRTSVLFQSLRGHRDDNQNQLAAWLFVPANPTSQLGRKALPVEINLWLFNGQPPYDGREVELIVPAFSYCRWPSRRRASCR
jgi:hypothetical protein